MTFQKLLDAAIEKNNSLLCVGLDPVTEKLPKEFHTKENPFFEFNKSIIDATSDLVCTFKPNSAFYEALGSRGVEELKMTCDYIKEKYPNIPILLDFKRGDIGNTNAAYAKFAFDYLNVDAVTLQPYQGMLALEPFLERLEKGLFILCKTSNEGSDEFQNLKLGEKHLFEIVAETVTNRWNQNKNCFLVAGATYPEDLERLRKLCGDMTFLVPGVGSQGGALKEILKVGLNSQNKGLIINASRAVIYSQNPRQQTQKLNPTYNQKP
jgi:orotidine-5'-phosphate decarboxylase